MDNWAYYTPDGVSDYLPELCGKKREIEQRLRDVFSCSGFLELESSGLEFYDAYTKNRSFAKQEELFKVQDERGRLLVLRYDGTIPVARLAATVLKHEPRPLRFAYIGRMYRFGEHGGGRMKEFTQAGVELLGSPSVAADAEVIALAIESLQAIGLDQIQIAVGQTAFFRSLAKDWGLEVETMDKLSLLLDERNEVAVWALLDRIDLDSKAKRVIDLLLTADGSWGLLEQLTDLCETEETRAVLLELEALRLLLDAWGLLAYCSLDLAELSGMNYYSGMIFRAYTYGIGFPVCSGGRYDEVVSSFGLPTAATGFSLGVDLSMQALMRQDRLLLDEPVIERLYIKPEDRAEALTRAKELRRAGAKVELVWLENGDLPPVP